MKATYNIESESVKRSEKDAFGISEWTEHETRIEMVREDGRKAVKYVTTINHPITKEQTEGALKDIAHVLGVTEY